MGRRKVEFYGRSLEEKYENALGLLEADDAYEGSDNLKKMPNVGIPVLDWERISNAIDMEIPSYAKEKINFFFTSEVGYRLRDHPFQDDDKEFGFGDLPFSEFLKKASKIETLARKLCNEIDGLGEIGSKLLLRPLPKAGLTSAERPDEFYAKVTGRHAEPTDSCFFDYYSFRKLLDYYSNLLAQNGGFKSELSDRFGKEPGYTWYEVFVRRVVLSFWPTDFPKEITIPTDTNPNYSSPIISVLEEIQSQFNQLAKICPELEGLYEDWSYRQHARIVIKLKEEFEKNGIFWTLTALMRYDLEQSEFG